MWCSRTNLNRLWNQDLPLCNTAEEIASLMGITIDQLCFLTSNRKSSILSHYICFKIPKKTGGERFISAPIPDLKQAQRWILRNILQKLEVHPAAHGFCQERSIITNATPHMSADIVINFDLKDFFPSIYYKRVKGLFNSLGYGETAANIFALFCTAPDIEQLQLNNKCDRVALKNRYLPQGSPTSPVISNLLCRNLDKRLTLMAKKKGFIYTRYADDLTFSASGKHLCHTSNIIKQVKSIVIDEGFTINQDKTRVMGKSQQQEVTGVVVNEKLNLSRKTLKQFRATLYQIETEGYNGKSWGKSKNVLPAIIGFANFVTMVNPEKGKEFQKQIKRIQKKYNSK